MSKTWYHIKPLTGVLDRRSTPDQVPFGGFRDRRGLVAEQEGKLARQPGWERFKPVLPEDDAEDVVFNNQDLHNQLLGLCQYYASSDPVHELDDSETLDFSTVCGTLQVRSGLQREPITFLFEAIGNGRRQLLAGTQTRLYRLNESSGNWQILADGWGGEFSGDCHQRRWQAAQVLDTVMLTNGYDPPLYWLFGNGPHGCSLQAVREIPDNTVIGLSQAQVVCGWRGTIFLGDVVMDGKRQPNLLIWSDWENPTSFDPGKTGTTAGSQVLDFGERILAMKVLGDYLLVYTDKSIWQVAVAVDAQGLGDFSFRQVYNEPKTGDGCLAYPNALVSVGDAHLYMARDGIYLFNLSMPKPERLEWLHRASSYLYDGLSEVCARGHVAEYNPATKEAFFSVVAEGSSLPGWTLVVNLRYLAATSMGKGFSAMCSYRSDRQTTLRDWLVQKGICTVAGLAPEMSYLKEGPAKADPVAEEDPPSCFYTTQTITFSTPLGDFTVEDWNQPEPDANSLCARFEGVRLDDLCRESIGKQYFLLADADDLTLKQYGEVFLRESCLDADEETYSADADNGYGSRLLSGPMDFGNPVEEKTVRGVEVEFGAAAQANFVPELQLKVGVSAQAVDPLSASGYCAIKWQTFAKQYKLECQSIKTAAQHETAGTRPSITVYWPVYRKGNYVYFDLSIVKSSESGAPDPPTGGESWFSRISLLVEK